MCKRQGQIKRAGPILGENKSVHTSDSSTYNDDERRRTENSVLREEGRAKTQKSMTRGGLKRISRKTREP